MVPTTAQSSDLLVPDQLPFVRARTWLIPAPARERRAYAHALYHWFGRRRREKNTKRAWRFIAWRATPCRARNTQTAAYLAEGFSGVSSTGARAAARVYLQARDAFYSGASPFRRALNLYTPRYAAAVVCRRTHTRVPLAPREQALLNLKAPTALSATAALRTRAHFVRARDASAATTRCNNAAHAVRGMRVRRWHCAARCVAARARARRPAFLHRNSWTDRQTDRQGRDR